MEKPEREVRKASHWQQATMEITCHSRSSRMLGVGNWAARQPHVTHDCVSSGPLKHSGQTFKSENPSNPWEYCKMLALRLTWTETCSNRKYSPPRNGSFSKWPPGQINRPSLAYAIILSIVGITRDYTPQSLCYCLFAPHIDMGAILRTHPVHGESHIQRNTNGEVATS